MSSTDRLSQPQPQGARQPSTPSDSSKLFTRISSAFKVSADELHKQCEAALRKLETALSEIGTLPQGEVNFKNSLLALEWTIAEFIQVTQPLTFLTHVSTVPEVREVGDRWERKFRDFFVGLYAREDLFLLLSRLKKNKKELGEVENRLLDEYLIEFRRNGLGLSPKKKELFVKKRKRLVQLESEYNRRLGEWDEHLDLSRKELTGVPERFIETLEEKNGKYRLNLSYPHYFAVMENAESEAVRKKYHRLFNQRGGKKNVNLLEEAMALRHELALLLGFHNHAEQVLDRNMAKKPAAVSKFLDRLEKRLKKKGREEISKMLEGKKEKKLFSWNWRYYETQLRKREFSLEPEKIREYLPLGLVLSGLFEIFGTIHNVQFINADEDVATWHKDVQAYFIKENGKIIALVFLDLFPRPGKYNHAAAFTLQQGHVQRNGSYNIPVSAVVANFNAPTEKTPSLLEHGEVETLFHEFGHIMHQLLTKATYPALAGTNVKIDFVEVPSQMMENWVWTEAMLEKFSGHYEDPKRKMPKALFEPLLKSRHFNSATKYLRQIAFAKLDLYYHTRKKCNSTRVYHSMMEKTMFMTMEKKAIPQASFGHLMGGYDAGYYGYLWAKVFAQDVFSIFEEKGILSPEVGHALRTKILERGGEVDPMLMLKDFLGRKPNEIAFTKSM